MVGYRIFLLVAVFANVDVRQKIAYSCFRLSLYSEGVRFV